MDTYEKIKKVLALGFMNFLDDNKPKDKMCLSNGECADIEKAFNEKDWPKLARYLDKYTESEDERIRRELIEYLRGDLDDITTDDTDRWVAYLEKQKEQKPNYCHHEVDETGWTEEYRKAYYDGWNNCNMQHEQIKADQEPAEWSEEDEILRVRTINRLETLNFHGISGKEIRESIDWLKSLRPQPSWKPSEEQMNMLRAVINDPNNSGAESCQLALRGIYEQLKKL